MDYQIVSHKDLKPFIDQESRVLILGSLPSRESRKQNFYYAHKSNRFYKVLSSIFDEEEPLTITDRKNFLLKHHIALYDSIYQCQIIGSSDSSIKDVIPTDIDKLILHTKILKVFTNGKTSYKYFSKFNKTDAILLPSTSSANAAYSLEKLIDEYSQIKDYIDD